jgi:transposase
MKKNIKSKKQSLAKKTAKKPADSLHSINPLVAGIDIGANSVFVCAPCNGLLEVREYSTLTADLKTMVKWLKSCSVKSCAMESTGVYWIPVYDLIEENGIEAVLVNAYHIKNVPGRKTDVKDCQWIQQLHSYGLLRGSFRPSKDILPLRAYVRQRSRLFEKGAQEVLLMHKALTQMNIRLNMVISDLTGLTGMRIIKAIIDGERNSKVLASLRDRRCQKNEMEIAKGLEGNYQDEHIFALQQAYEAYQFFHQQILDCEKAIKKELEKNQTELVEDKQTGTKSRSKTIANQSAYHFDAPKLVLNCTQVNLLEIPGFEANTIVKILSEVGTDMSRWPTSGHFASWLGLCPGNKISGGKILSSKTRLTSNKAAQALRIAANALYRSKTALGAFFRRMRAKLGAPKAITAAAHKLAKVLYNMLKFKKSFRELGNDYYEAQYKKRLLASMKKRAKELGFCLVPLTVEE